jgi:hypothetical protein
MCNTTLELSTGKKGLWWIALFFLDKAFQMMNIIL